MHKASYTIAIATVAAALLALLLMPMQVVGQDFGGRFQEEEGGAEQEQTEEDSTPFVHGITIGTGITTYHGDLSQNPNDNILKYVGSASPSVLVRADRRFGQFQQFGMNVELQYHRISGKNTSVSNSGNQPLEFSNNLIGLDFTADYDLPYIQQGLFRVFLGGGPLFVISPSYSNFPEEDERFDPLGSRVVGSVVAGVSMFDTFRIGFRVSSDFLDGHTGFDGKNGIDYLGFIGVTRRFSFR